MCEAQALGIEVPGALSIVDCDHLPIASQTMPVLTTSLLPTYGRVTLGHQLARARTTAAA